MPVAAEAGEADGVEHEVSIDEAAAAIAARASAGGSAADYSTMAADLAKNPAVLAALQAQLGGLEGLSSGLMESLPASVKRRVKALKKMQLEQVTLEAQYQQELNLLDLKYDALKKPVFAKRSTIISGGYEPTEEECDYADEEDEDEEPITEVEEGEDDIKGIPQFWLQAFQNCPVIEEAIEDHDVEVLRSLTDVHIDYSSDGKSFQIVFDFEENEFFTDASLSKTYHINLEPAEGDLIFDGPSYASSDGCTINWNKDMDVTHKVTKKTQRKKKGPAAGKTRTVTRVDPQPSFFRFFDPPKQPEDDEEMEEEHEAALFQDYEMADFLKDKVVPRAVLWFTGEALDYEDEMGDEEDEDDLAHMMGGGDDDDDDEDPDYVPPAGGFGAEQPECKQS